MVVSVSSTVALLSPPTLSFPSLFPSLRACFIFGIEVPYKPQFSVQFKLAEWSVHCRRVAQASIGNGDGNGYVRSYYQ